jgi:DUF2892 family protein
MTRNLGRIDQFIRVIVGLALFAYVFKDGTANATWSYYIPVALILIVTAFFSFCPLYTLRGRSTASHSKPAP